MSLLVRNPKDFELVGYHCSPFPSPSLPPSLHLFGLQPSVVGSLELRGLEPVGEHLHLHVESTQKFGPVVGYRLLRRPCLARSGRQDRLGSALG